MIEAREMQNNALQHAHPRELMNFLQKLSES